MSGSAVLPSSRAAPPPGRAVRVTHTVNEFSERWVVGEEPVPEAAWHARAVRWLHALLEHWVRRTGRNAEVFGNLAVRVDPARPGLGISPDLILVEPAPPGARDLASLRLWEPGHAPPSLVVEVVSPGHPYKDYVEIPDQCAVLGVRELVVFDPTEAGPKTAGETPWLQVWRRTEADAFERVACGKGPSWSEVLGAYFVAGDGDHRLRIAEDEGGQRLWLTAEEAERAAKEAERAAKEAERAAKEAERAAKEAERAAKEAERAAKEAERLEKERALARVAELERELARRGG